MRIASTAVAFSTLAYLVSLVVAAPIITAGPSLTEATWAEAKEGTWLVEHYSPYCHHCRDFAPTWRTLVDTLSPTSSPQGFHFAQVDCAANGDLCKAHGVKFYPSLFLYVGGELYDEYEGKRTIEALSAYVEENMPGKVVWIDDDDVLTAPSPTSEAEVKETKAAVKPKGKDRMVLKVVGDSAKDPTALELLMGTPSAVVDPILVTSTALSSSAEPEPTSAAPDRLRPAFVAQQLYVDEQKRETPSDAPDGTVHVLEADEVAAVKAKGAGPAFVKFFAPWCGHCKTLAPKWKEVATALKGQVNVYEMDCDDARNKRVCKAENIQGFPTLVFYNEGARVEYKGKRDPASMKAFAIKAATSTAIKPIANEYELKRAASADDILFLFLHTADTSREDVALAQDASKHLIAGPPFYVSSSVDLFELFSLPPLPTLLVFKDHSLLPSSSFPLPPSSLTARTRTDLILDWLRTAKLALVTELTGESYADIMATTGNPPLVGVVVLSPKRLGEDVAQAVLDVHKLAKGWQARAKKDGKPDARTVIWSWVDGDKWGSWAKSLYGVKAGVEPVVVISDPKELMYWKTGIDDVPLSVSGETVYELIEDGIFTGALAPQSSRNFVERFGSKLASKAAAVTDQAIDHPLLALLLVSLATFGIWSAIKWVSGSGPAVDRPNGAYAKLE